MKKQFQITSLLLFLAIFPNIMASCQNERIKYSIDIELKDAIHGETLFLQKYVGKTLVTIDSIASRSASTILFKGKPNLEPGMFAISLKHKPFVNFFISKANEQQFTISLDAQNPAQTLTFTGSPENQAFIDYLRFLGSKYQSQDEIKQKGDQLQKQFPNSMLALFIQTMKEPEVPEPTKPVSDLIGYKYGYLSNHYFDNIDFADKRLLNTPLLEQKLGFYFKQMVSPMADSIIERVDQTLKKAKANNEVYLWTVRYLYNLYREAPIEGNTEVYHFIGENYILSEPDRWNDKPFVEKVRNRLAKSKLNPVGEKATNLILQSPDGKKVDLHSIKANFTVLFFYNPECEACRPVTAALSELYKQFSNKGIEVFAVNVDKQKEHWLNYISEIGLDWINVYDPNGADSIEEKYDINAIPIMYLLDKNKSVIIKNMPISSIKTYLTSNFF